MVPKLNDDCCQLQLGAGYSPLDLFALEWPTGQQQLGCFMQLPAAAGQLIVVASYFDYVRLRNHLRAEAADAFVGVCEYTDHPEAARRRTYFRQARGSWPAAWQLSSDSSNSCSLH